MPIELRGTEEVTLMLSGSVERAAAQARLAGTSLTLPPGEARVSLVLLWLRGLHLRGLRWPAFDYGEALWRVAVDHAGQPAWLVLACDLDDPLIAWSAARLQRYPVRRARLRWEPAAARFTSAGAAGDLRCEVRADNREPPLPPPRPLLVQHAGRLYRVPWGDDIAPSRQRCAVALSEQQRRARSSWACASRRCRFPCRSSALAAWMICAPAAPCWACGSSCRARRTWRQSA